jgi:hypothetical protein
MEPTELGIFFLVVIGCNNLDPEQVRSIAVLKVWGGAASSLERKTRTFP